MSLHSTEACVGSRHTVFLGVPRICIMSLYFGQVERGREGDVHPVMKARCMMHGEVEFCDVTPRPAKNNDERAAAAATIISPQRRESISWVGASVQRRAGVHSWNAG